MSEKQIAYMTAAAKHYRELVEKFTGMDSDTKAIFLAMAVANEKEVKKWIA